MTEKFRVTDKMKQVWSVELDLLNVFKTLCEKHGLRYFIWSGTLIGAVRHQGFIPWDDDIDVAMPRRDFEQFKLLAKSELQMPYQLESDETDSGRFRGGLCRLRNSNTTGVEALDLKRKSNWGIWIDILVLDYVYGDEIKRQEQLRKIGIYKRLCLLQTYGEGHWELQCLSKNKKYAYRLIVKYLGREKLLKRFEDACRVCPESEARFVNTFTSAFQMDGHRCLYKEDFSDTVDMIFEGMSVAAPIGYDQYLGMINGDYMKYPPKELMVPKHRGVFDPSTPYRVWQHRLAETFQGAEDKTIVIFGAGNMFEDYMRRFGTKYRPAFIVDNGREKWGKLLHGIMVHMPSELLSVPKERLRVVICNIYYREIEKQLHEMGIEDYYLHIENPDWVEDILFRKAKNAEAEDGKKMLKSPG